MCIKDLQPVIIESEHIAGLTYYTFLDIDLPTNFARKLMKSVNAFVKSLALNKIKIKYYGPSFIQCAE